LSELLAGWSTRFEDSLAAAMLRRLGIASGDNDRQIAAVLIRALATREATIDRVFFDWRGGRDPGAEIYPTEPFRALAKLLEGRARVPSHPYWSGPEPCSMHIDEVEVIWSAIAERDDWQPFDDKVTAVRLFGEAMEQDAPAT
jgi:hypothetical protein